MNRELAALEERVFDVLIVGGGITGACVAFDAATRGLSVALVEKGDWGAATSASSSKLLHGGLRYLQQLRFRKVRESAAERLRFQNLAPHLLRWVPFVVPTYRDPARGKAFLAAGMAAYGLLCRGLARIVQDPARRVPPGRWLTAAEVRERVPGFDPEGLTGGRLFHECHIQNSERMTLAFVAGAARAGAAVANYVRVDDFLRDAERVVGVRATDLAGGATLEVRARLVVNAAGPWIRQLNEGLGADVTGVVTGLSRGAHLVTRALTHDVAVALPTRRPAEAVVDRGGRHVFVIPWRGHSLIGTSYASHRAGVDWVAPTDEDIDALVADIDAALGGNALSRDDVLWAYAGLYPLTTEEIRPDVYQGTGDYRIVDHAEADGVPGVLSVFGAKYTTARLLAERAVDRAAALLGEEGRPCRTRDTALPAGEINDLEGYRAARRRELRDLLDEETVDHLVTAHGRRLDAIIRLLRERPELAERVTPPQPVLLAEVVHAVREEMALTLDDVVFRRTGLGTLGNPGEEALGRVAATMAAETGWDAARIEAETAAVRERFTR